MKFEPIKANASNVWVRYAGHDAMFVADIYVRNGIATVVANGNLDAPDTGSLIRPADRPDVGRCEFHLLDTSTAVYWRPNRGIFVVPVEQVVHLPQNPTGLRVSVELDFEADLDHMRFIDVERNEAIEGHEWLELPEHERNRFQPQNLIVAIYYSLASEIKRYRIEKLYECPTES